jgi:hypothetical protein
MAMPNASASTNAGRIPADRLARKTSAEAETVAPSASDMMLPVSVMKVMPTATQPMNDMAVSRALMLSSEVNPGVLSAKLASASPAMARTASTTWRTRTSPNRSLSCSKCWIMPPRPGE